MARVGGLIRRFMGRQKAASAEAPVADPAEVLSALDEPFRSTLIRMYGANSLPGSDGQMHPFYRETGIPAEQGRWMYDLCRSTKASRTLEVGFAYGFSTLFFLAAVTKNGGGAHVAVDPFELSHWHGIGLAAVREVGMESGFRHLSELSDRAATDLAREEATFDVIFIDGNHRFDDAIVDFSLYSPRCKRGGHIVLDDMWMPSLQSAASFVRTNRSDFAEVATPLPRLAVFQKVGEDERRWDHFEGFSVANAAGKAR
jgi:predicted O-methyltransferase YrrM